METAIPDIKSFIPYAKILARRIAWIPADEDDLVQEGLLALHLALQKTKDIKCIKSFSKTVMSRHMQNYYRPKDRKNPPPVELLPEHYPTENSREESALGRIDIRRFLRSLEEAEGKIARQAAEMLLTRKGDLAKTPAALTRSALLAGMTAREITRLLRREFPEYAEGSIKRRIYLTRKELEENGELVNLPKRIGSRTRLERHAARDPGRETKMLVHRHVREALGLSVTAWFDVLSRIRRFACSWFDLDLQRAS